MVIMNHDFEEDGNTKKLLEGAFSLSNRLEFYNKSEGKKPFAA